MPRYRDTRTGRIITVDGGDPSADELEEMFKTGGSTFRLAGAPTDQRTLLGGPEARMSAAPQERPQHPSARLGRAVMEGLFGSPERVEYDEETRQSGAQGVGQTPTPAQMIDAGLTLSAPLTLPLAGAEGLAALGIKGAAKAIGRGVVTRAPRAAAGAAVGAGEEYLRGGSPTGGAIVGGAVGAGVPGAAKVANLAGRGVGRGLARGIAEALIEERAAAKAAPAAAKANPLLNAMDARVAAEAPATESQLADFAKSISAESPNKVTRAATAKARSASVGAETAARHNELMQFGKRIAAENPKVGDKIYLILDSAGKPIEHISSAQVGAATKAGKNVTWIRNIFTAPRGAR